MPKNFEVPSDPAILRKIKDCLTECANISLVIESSKDQIKDIKDRLKDEYDIPTSVANQLIKLHLSEQTRVETMDFYENLEDFLTRIDNL